MELADTSAWSKSRHAPAEIREDFDRLLVGGQIATCEQVALELLYSTQDAAEFAERRQDLALLPQCPITLDVWARAIEVFESLAQPGSSHHRGVNPADLIIAAAAETAGVGLVHYDAHFDAIAAVTRQPTRWLAPRGSLP